LGIWLKSSGRCNELTISGLKSSTGSSSSLSLELSAWSEYCVVPENGNRGLLTRKYHKTWVVL
jgi:hypothetical protein